MKVRDWCVQRGLAVARGMMKGGDGFSRFSWTPGGRRREGVEILRGYLMVEDESAIVRRGSLK